MIPQGRGREEQRNGLHRLSRCQSPSPYGDIYHDAVPVIVTTVAEYAETMRLSREDFGCEACDDATPLAITLGMTQCGVWLEGKVLLDTLPR